MRSISTFSFIFLSCLSLQAQTTFDKWLKPKQESKIEPFAMVQLWGTYTFNQEVYNKDTGLYEKTDDRWNILLRRARLGIRAEPYNNLKFTLVGAYDLIGRDLHSGIDGGANNGSSPDFGILDAFFQWQIKSDKDAFHLTGGYFRPQFGRENITSGWSVTSMDKAMSQSYIRRHLVGIGSGRAIGLNLGGLLWKEGNPVGFNYNIGIFNPVSVALNGNSTGASFGPLIAARGVFNFGDPEMTRYRTSYDMNYYNERKGLSVGLAGAWQGQTELFQASYATEIDALFNWGPINLDGEWIWMWREGNSTTQNSQTGHIRLGYNVVLSDRYFLEPTFMLMVFNGGLSAKEQQESLRLGDSAGEERTYDLGINWHIDRKRLKVMLHYTWRKGNAGDAGSGAAVNSYFYQSGLGPIHRGNWLGLGMNVIF